MLVSQIKLLTLVMFDLTGKISQFRPWKGSNLVSDLEYIQILFPQNVGQCEVSICAVQIKIS